MIIKIIKMIAMVMTIFIGFILLALVIFYFWASSGSLPKEKLVEIKVFPGQPVELSDENQTFIVMTYNIGYLSGMFNNHPVKTSRDIFEKNMQAFLQLLENVRPDFIGFQEIDFHSHRTYYIDQLQTIGESVHYKYGAVAVNWDKHYVPFPYWPPAVHFGKMLSGQAILSRWPILSDQRVLLEKPGNRPFFYNALYLDRLVQVVKIQIKERELIVLNVHLEAFDRETRERQAAKVLDIYRSFKDKYPVLLIGDFNSTPPSASQKKNFVDEPGLDFTAERTIELFLAEKSLSTAGADSFTFPSQNPTRKLDYIFYNHDKIKPVKSWVQTGIHSSDHLPLLMEFSFKL